MRIKILNINDFEQLRMFHVKHCQNYIISNNSFKAYLSQKQYQVFGMFHVEHLVGYSIFLVSCDEADLVYIFIHPNFRRHGVGTKLIKSFARSALIRKIFLEVSSQNGGALEFYKSLGFRAIGYRTCYYKCDDAVLMLCELL